MQTVDLRSLLPQLIPLAVEWAEQEAARGAAIGGALNGQGLELARTVGVAQPERIRIVSVHQLPQPQDPLLRQAADQTGLLRGTGLTLGYTVFLCKSDKRLALLAHECRHVAQYERFGSVEAFLTVYLTQIATVGYDNAELEADARAHEVHGA